MFELIFEIASVVFLVALSWLFVISYAQELSKSDLDLRWVWLVDFFKHFELLVVLILWLDYHFLIFHSALLCGFVLSPN